MIPVLKHHNLAQAVVQGLTDIFTERQYADKVVPKLLQSNPKWGSRDRHAIAFTIYEMVRNWRLLCETAGYPLLAKPTKEQMWQLVAVWLMVNDQSLPYFEEFLTYDVDAIKEKHRQLLTVRATRESIPDWLDLMAEEQLGEQWDDEIAKLNRPAPLVIRVNSLKTNMAKMLNFFKELQITATPLEGLPDALLIETNKQLFKTHAFINGWFEVQDAASQMVVPFLDAQPEMLVVDACSGAGGKALHISALLNNRCRLIAYDTDKVKLSELKKRAERNNAKVTILAPQFPPDAGKTYLGKADRLLLDVPCSGLGTLRRRPDLKWKLTPDNLQELQKTQQHILTRYMPLLKVGGIAVYATCSILPSENEQQIDRFLAQHAGTYQLLEHERISPSHFGFDGFFMAKLQRIT
jgi:16S rRNA (cytosine967-C5)-methyltransferase